MEDFLVEFHRRRRVEAPSRLAGMGQSWLRFCSWFARLGAARWAYVGGLGGLGYATALAIILAAPKHTPPGLPEGTLPVSHVTAPAEKPVEQLDALDLRPSAQGRTGEQEF